MDTLWIGNGRLVLPQRVLENGSVLIEDGRIIEIGHPCPRNVQRADADGGYILPGFIDLHVHGGGGADAMDATVQALHMIEYPDLHLTVSIGGVYGTCPLDPGIRQADKLLYQAKECRNKCITAAFSAEEAEKPKPNQESDKL